MKVLLMGATGTLGQELSKKLKESTHAVRILAREPHKVFLPKDEAFEVVQGDALNPDDVKRAMEGADVVISCIGPRSKEDSKNMICTKSTTNVLAENPKRYIVVSGAVVKMEGDEKKSLASRMFQTAFEKTKKPIFEDRMAEKDLLVASDCDWTLVRMPHLQVEDEGMLEASDKHMTGMKISTGPLSEWIIKALVEENKFLRKGAFVASTQLKK